MTVSLDVLGKITKDYGWCSSWGIWADEGDKPKSNIGDLTVFDFDKNPGNRLLLHTNFIAVGLNVSSTGQLMSDFANFHSKSPAAQDYKLRYAFQGTPVWGCYMTDILKNFPEVDSSKVKRSIQEDPGQLERHYGTFRTELSVLGAEDPTFLALGNLAFDLLRDALPVKSKILKIKHYSHRISREAYREELLAQLDGSTQELG